MSRARLEQQHAISHGCETARASQSLPNSFVPRSIGLSRLLCLLRSTAPSIVISFILFTDRRSCPVSDPSCTQQYTLALLLIVLHSCGHLLLIPPTTLDRQKTKKHQESTTSCITTLRKTHRPARAPCTLVNASRPVGSISGT